MFLSALGLATFGAVGISASESDDMLTSSSLWSVKCTSLCLNTVKAQKKFT